MQLGSDATADKETKTEWRATVKDQDNLADSMLSEINSLYSGDGEAVGRDMCREARSVQLQGAQAPR